LLQRSPSSGGFTGDTISRALAFCLRILSPPSGAAHTRWACCRLNLSSTCRPVFRLAACIRPPKINTGLFRVPLAAGQPVPRRRGFTAGQGEQWHPAGQAGTLGKRSSGRVGPAAPRSGAARCRGASGSRAKQYRPTTPIAFATAKGCFVTRSGRIKLAVLSQKRWPNCQGEMNGMSLWAPPALNA